MARTTVNFGEVQGFDPVPADDYSVIIEKAEYREASEEGKFDYINLTLKITEGEHEGRNVWMVWSFSPKALWRMKDDLVELEVIGPDDELEFDYDEDAENALVEPEVVGLPAIATVGLRTYEGREQNQVEGLRAQSGPAKKTAAGAKKTPPKKGGAAAAAPKKTGGRKFA